LLQVPHHSRLEICEHSHFCFRSLSAHEYRWDWQDKAYEQSQKYKEGKYILERNLLVDVQ